MAAFLDCPTELIDTILEQVSFRDLTALSLASKKLHDFATPQLYSYIDLSIHQGNARPIIHLTRSIFNNLGLAKYVKSVRLRDGDEEIQKLYRGYSYDKSVPEVSTPRPTDEDGKYSLATKSICRRQNTSYYPHFSDLTDFVPAHLGMPEFTRFIKKTGLSYADLWIDKLRIAHLNAFVALLLSRLPDLKSFRIGYAAIVPYVESSGKRNRPNIAGENQFLGKLFQSSVFNTSDHGHGLSQFQKLEEISFPGPISIDPGRNPDFCNPSDMVALLSLPSIRSIRGWCWNPSSLPWPTDLPAPAHLTSLTLSYIHVDFLAQILARTRALKTLCWNWKWIQDTHPLNTDTIDLNRFVEAVQPIWDTLEDLTIGFEFDDMSWGGIEPGMMKALGTLHGLEGFTNIRRFQAPLGVLLPDWDWYAGADPTRRLEDSLPRNVEVVTVTDAFMSDYYAYDEYEELDFVRAWLFETASTRTPRLKEVCYYLDRNDSEFEEKSCEPIKQTFEGTNVRYRIIKARDEKPWENV